ncbi:ATP-binding cassette domain-containing protein [Pigmentibacter sp. JX0631]|uniref:ATP-binding cassette domain-containing protein n=1 Tax=Pigmentibacter sp. JX0631 TaxID=2976982 RepID=UPI0024696C90|nr:ATP-binding cassette domain-containing protein [Pigmentibacter sp. JX0631]WGL60165.1 ATP-binding cassette domain-containing protein [Pigmentibacter sp. JX0631]
MSYLSWQQLVVGYPNKKPLTNPFSGEITNPGIFAIIGQNGCGKSTLLKTWLGLIKPLNGTVLLNDAPIPTEHNISQGIAYVPQFHTVNRYFHISVYDFIKQGKGPSHTFKEQDITEINSLLNEWQLNGYGERSFHELSGGQKTRAMIIRAVLSKPKMLFLDEPLASLDSCCQQQLIETLETLTQENKVCVFIVDHHLENFNQFITKKIKFTRKHDQEISTIIM